MIKLLLNCLLFLFVVFASEAQTSLEQLDLPYGNLNVGFKHYTASDHTRTYFRKEDWTATSIPRPIPISIWYPTDTSTVTGGEMSILDYIKILQEEEEWEFLPEEFLFSWFPYLYDTPSNRAHLKEKAQGINEGIPKTGSFPVIIYAPSYQASSIENFALCELLASHGYIVISSPSRGTHSRKLTGGNIIDAETQARDIEFLIMEAGKIPSTNIGKIAAIGFSFGGMSQMIAQMRNSNIQALVSLDGKERYDYQTLSKSPYFNRARINVPYIHLSQKEIPTQVLKEDGIDEKLNTEFQLYDSLPNSDIYRLKFHHLTHSYFSSFGIFFSNRDSRQDKTDLEIMTSYKLASRYTLQFLNAYLKADDNALLFINNDPSVNEISTKLLSSQTKKAKKAPFAFRNFNDLAAKQNYEHLNELYQSIKRQHPDFELLEPRLNNLGLQLVFNPEKGMHGISILKLAVQLFPNSANLFDSLAEGYLHIGNKPKAIQNFKVSLALDPQNTNAVKRLQELKK